MVETIISSLVTIIGFFISFLVIKRELNNSLHIQHNEFLMKKMDDIIEMINDNILYTLDIFKSNKTENSAFNLSQRLELLYKKILPYGTYKDIMILETIQTAAYSWEIKKEKYKNYNLYFIANMYLLMCQIKMEMTGIIVNPESLFRMKFSDYESKKADLTLMVNDTVNNLDLCKKFLIK